MPTYFGPKDGPVGKFPRRNDVEARIDRVNQYGTRVAKAVEVVRDEPGVDRASGMVAGLPRRRAGLGAGRGVAGEIKAAVDYFGYIGSDSIYKRVAKLPSTVIFHNPKDGIVDPVVSRKFLEAWPRRP